MGGGTRSRALPTARRSRKPLERPRLGLLVNPIAGMGGAVGLKGTDSTEIVARARVLGAQPQSPGRAITALRGVHAVLGKELAVVAAPNEMGADEARAAGFVPEVVGAIRSGASSPEDTEAIALGLVEAGIALLLFAGGDGTARNVYNAIDGSVPVVGIPAGVKMHSAVYATNPRTAADLVINFFDARLPLREVEVMDIDEEAFRRGAVSARLYGYLNVPFAQHLLQGAKMGQAATDDVVLAAIAADVVDHMQPGCLYVLGPGTTTREIARRLKLTKTLLGVDLVKNGALVGADVIEAEILSAIAVSERARIVVTPIGGQGHFFGRGNQQISAAVIRQIGKDNIIIVGAPEKLTALSGELHVDTGDPEVDEMLSGYCRVVTGYRSETVCSITA